MNENFIETIKNIAAVLGCIVTLSGVLSAISKNVRLFFNKIFNKIFNIYGEKKDIENLKEYIDKNIKSLQEGISELSKNIQEFSKKQDEHLKTYEDKIKNFESLMEIDTEFVRTQCRNIIKNMFYKYCKEEKLPLYEYKTLLKVEELYIVKCHGNSFAGDLIKRMKTWEIDYSNNIELEED